MYTQKNWEFVYKYEVICVACGRLILRSFDAKSAPKAFAKLY